MGAKTEKGGINMSDCCCEKTKTRTDEEKTKLMNRLVKIEGQVRGLEKMLEDSRYCTDILTQVAAVTAALNSFSRELLANHIRSCVVEDIRCGKDETVEDLLNTLQKMMK